MDKTLETATLLYRLIIALALALFLLALSTPPPNPVYDDAAREIDSLQEGIEAVSDQVQHVNEKIYKGSSLRLGALEWLRRHNAQQRDVSIAVINAEELVVPDSNIDPLATLDAQLKWANRIYRELGSPFLLCQVDARQVQRVLDRTLGISRNPKIERFTVHFSSAKPAVALTQHWSCAIDLSYEVHEGQVIGLRSTNLDVPTSVVNITRVEPWVDLSLANTFKDHELGDWEDNQALLVPSIWRLWSDLGTRSPAAAEAFLEQKKEEEFEKSKEKLDILGQSLSRSLTIVMGCFVQLCLMVYLLATVCQIRMMVSDHQSAISESAFYGVMRTRVGKTMMLLSAVMPFGVSLFVLLIEFPPPLSKWAAPPWMASWIIRLLLVMCIGLAASFLIIQTRATLPLLRRESATAKPADVTTDTAGVEN